MVEIKPQNNNETIDLSYQVICKSNEWTRETISREEENNIDIAYYVTIIMKFDILKDEYIECSIKFIK